VELLLVRHAIAFERSRLRWRNDNLRPLTPSGIKRMRKAAMGLGVVAAVPTEVLSSPLVRARQTADILHEKARWPVAAIAQVLAPGQPLARVVAAIAQRPAKHLAIVGHEPDLGRLLAHCLIDGAGTMRLEFKKGGVACVSFAGAIVPGRGRLRWMLAPRALRAMARGAETTA
jgi:phosphohistidine phosphatase